MVIWDYFKGSVSGVSVNSYDEQEAACKVSARAESRFGEMLEDMDAAQHYGLSKIRHHSYRSNDVFAYDLGHWWAYLLYRNFPNEAPVLVGVYPKADRRAIQRDLAERLSLI